MSSPVGTADLFIFGIFHNLKPFLILCKRFRKTRLHSTSSSQQKEEKRKMRAKGTHLRKRNVSGLFELLNIVRYRVVSKIIIIIKI